MNADLPRLESQIVPLSYHDSSIDMIRGQRMFTLALARLYSLSVLRPRPEVAS